MASSLTVLRLPELSQLAELFLIRFGDLLVLRWRDEFFLAASFRGFVNPFEGREVFAKRRHARRAESLSRGTEYFEPKPQIAANDFDHIARPQITRGFHALAAECHIPFGTGLGGEGAGFKNSHMMQPFIGPLGCHRLAHALE